MGKPFKSTNRFYRQAMRDHAQACGETAFQIMSGETDLLIVADADYSQPALETVRILRGTLQSWILLYPEFASSLIPLQPPVPLKKIPEIVRRMYMGSEHCAVGPMAAVAGITAEITARELAKKSSDIIVENGGDNFIFSTKERLIALLAEPESGVKIGTKIPAEDFPLSICSSSATVGHSLSLGHGDIVTVRGKCGATTDAAATRLCNMLKTAGDLQHVLDEAQRIAEKTELIDGIFAQCGEHIAAWGKMELTAIE
jgi:ApbE superfamily uncharacterized protein (UPF0280 family)